VENARIAENDLFGVQNSRKARTGILGGLLDPEVMNAKIADEKRVRAAVEANAELKAKAGGAWDRMTKSRDVARSMYTRYATLGGSGMNLGCDLFAKAKDLVRLAAEADKPNGERLREYRDSARDTLELQLYSPAPIYQALELDRMASALSRMAEYLGGEDPIVQKALAGKSPRARAEELVLTCKLADVAERKRIAAGGKAAIEASTDPMIKLARELDPDARALHKR
jgi:hypothetical protein